MQRLSRALFPVAPPVARLELAAVFVLGSLAAFFRLGDVGLRGNVWAEDGRVFLQRALLHHGPATLFEPYSGYLHLVPRTLAMLVASLPLSSQGIALDLVAALVQAGVATLAYFGTAGIIGPRLLRALIALAVVAVPVGTEVIDAISNLQWFLLFGGCVCLLWTPRWRSGWVVLFFVLALVTMSSPFAVILLAGALGRLLVQRSRAAAMLAAVVAAGFAVQTVVMVTAPPRTGINKVGVDLAPRRLIAGFVGRVLGDGVFGVGRHQPDQPAWGLLAGGTVVVLLAVLVFCLRMNDGFEVLVRVSVLGALALLTYSVPVVATPTLPAAYPFGDGRFYVTPVLLTIAAIMCLVAAALEVPGRNTARFRRVGIAASGVLLVSLTWGLGSSWNAGQAWGRQNGPSWQREVGQARTSCAGVWSRASVNVPISPPGWSMAVPCERLRDVRGIVL